MVAAGPLYPELAADDALQRPAPRDSGYLTEDAHQHTAYAPGGRLRDAQNLCRGPTAGRIQHHGPHPLALSPHRLADRLGKSQYAGNPPRPLEPQEA